LPRIKLDKTKARSWGVYTYMIGALRKDDSGQGIIDRTRFTHANSWERNEKGAVAYAVKWSTSVWACLPYFSVPMATAHFGELRNKGFIGFALDHKYYPFDKPLRFFDALREIEAWRKSQG
jgi:hypothetical protein